MSTSSARKICATAVIALASAGFTLGSGPTDASAAPTADSIVTAWGGNDFGQTDVPTSLQGTTVTAISAGMHHALALSDDGVVTAWGANDFGQTDVPASLADHSIVAISAGDTISLALTDDGQVIAWGGELTPGADDHGSAGEYTDDVGTVPNELTGKTVVAIDARAPLAVTSDGDTVVWGRPTSPALSPDPGTPFIATATGNFTVALLADGSVTSWGYGGEGGDGQPIPPALSESAIVAVAAGSYHALALTDDGAVIGWGHHGNGEPTAGCSDDVPTSLVGQRVTAIADTSTYSLALTDDGRVTVWSAFCRGDLPDALTDQTVRAIAGGGDFSLALSGNEVADVAPTEPAVVGPNDPMMVERGGSDTPLAPLLIGAGGLLITGIAIGTMLLARKRSA